MLRVNPRPVAYVTLCAWDSHTYKRHAYYSSSL